MTTNFRNRSSEEGSVTLTWESAAVTVLVLVGLGSLKYMTTTADCAQQDAVDWVECSNVLDASCNDVVPKCKEGVSSSTASSGGPSPCRVATNARTDGDNRAAIPPGPSSSAAGTSVSSSSAAAVDEDSSSAESTSESADEDLSSSSASATPTDPCL